MICKNCGNSTKFTMIKETALWDDKKKIFQSIVEEECCEYYVCDTCMDFDEPAGHIDTEGDFLS